MISTAMTEPLVDFSSEHFPWKFDWLILSSLLEAAHSSLAPENAVELLRLWSEAIDAGELQHGQDPMGLLRTKAINKKAGLFLTNVLAMNAEQRDRCCVPGGGKFAKLVNGRALVLDPHVNWEPLFKDNPVGWILNALYGMEREIFPLKFPIPAPAHFRCSALAIMPSLGSSTLRTSCPVIPLVYTGMPGFHTATLGVHRAMDRWRAALWLGDIRDAYALIGAEIQAHWVKQVPRAIIPDPIYRFLLDPSAELRHEGLIFLRTMRYAGADPRNGNDPADPDEERDRYIYDQWLAGVPYSKIMAAVNSSSQGWSRLETANGVKLAAQRYAKRHGLPVPLARKPGRKSHKK